MVEVFNTHKFLFTLNYENRVKGLTVLFLNADNDEVKIELDWIEIGTSHVSCKLYDTNGNRYIVPFIRIRKVFDGKEMIWDNTDTKLDGVKVIKGFE